jgi:hypothetical protein
MKKKFLFRLFLPFLFCSFIACSTDQVDYGLGEYYVEIVTVLNDDAFLLDNGKIVYVSKKGDYSFESGDRIYLNFSYSDKNANQIVINTFSKISKGKLNVIGEKEILEYGNNPVLFECAWIGSHYLNIQFYMEYKSEPHKIGLLVDKMHVDDQNVNLYFRHNKNNDKQGYPVLVFASFDLNEILGEAHGNRTLLVNFNTTNYGNVTYKYKY